MIVLGIHDGHTAGSALIKDGEVLSAISEERLTNVKNYSGAPLLSIRKVFEIAGVLPREVDLIAIGCLVRVGSPYADQNTLAKIQVRLSPFLHSHIFAKSYVNFFHLFRESSRLKKLFLSLGMEKVPIQFIDHHHTHAACAYYQRPWKDESVVLTLDGSGDGLSATVSVGKGNTIRRISETTFYDSLSNNLYSEMVGFLGMKRWEHEYKLMGLAPYGKDDGLINFFKKVIRINPKNPLEFQNTSESYLYNVTKKLTPVLVGRRFDNIAWATQTYYEDLLCSWVKNAVLHTGIRNIVCAGGSFLNVKANKKIRELKEVGKFFVYPASDDGGTPVGAALVGYVELCRQKKFNAKVKPLENLYYGQKFSNEQIESVIKKSKWKKYAVYYKTGIEKKCAKLLSKGSILARFAGRDEWGPRALGNRSILADPRNLSVIQKLNFAIKQRDFWMPFAASLLPEDGKKYLKNYRKAPYMIEAFDTTQYRDDIIAAIHPYDKTCRPQMVTDKNDSYKAIISEFKKITGVGALLNTSFNLHGYPIVGSPEIALKTFEGSGLDGLILENWLILK
ncbi:hypothetical protein A3D77_07320 [Candidatus Gottesmanbacteria bacterium RIFCSPHIGHO2_02_FULL_39_11]|uniref:Carbamoyl transferase n=1 Tax=Candidatus Gottesmanbacteria bacterium RIFCSPHIGHO2_02_FULL_39_11 TaxID=1798382 RepID=A0A1F5ZK33_9BACT|nr:MAG: hypothetical protein A3D77_07320 [Candidatus Gottesmanbacteria bacterium RIFCSPHIGHO2_02_FULL_39_11]